MVIRSSVWKLTTFGKNDVMSEKSSSTGYRLVLSFLALTFLSIQSVEVIIIDHTCIDTSQIPAQWITAAKALKLHYGHTSPGEQLVYGLQFLEDATFQYAWAECYLPAEAGALCVLDGQPYDSGCNDSYETYVEHHLYRETADGR